MSERQLLFPFRRWAYAVKRSWETQEAYWFWKWGRWEWEAGLFQGFGFGLLLFSDELALTFACFGASAVRKDEDARN